MRTGTVYHSQESSIGIITMVDDATFTEVSITIGGIERVTFPLPVGLDDNTIAIITSNICNQTGLLRPPVRVAFDPV